MDRLRISDVRLVSGSHANAKTGLVGYISATLNGALRLEGLALRRTADDRLVLSFPARRDSSGRQHPFIRPLNDAARQTIGRQVFQALGLEEALP